MFNLFTHFMIFTIISLLKVKVQENYNNLNGESYNQIFYLRIVALWAFSESAFGGILHALTIPLRGLFISSAAVLFISLLALFSRKSKEIIKATLIVILIKAIVSPHSPLTAYLALSIQGVLGFLLFYTKRFYKLSALFLGILVLFFSGIQKIIVLTILFGNTLWESLDIFIKQISSELFNVTHPEFNYGYILVSFYVLLHIIAGIYIGIYAGKLPQKINYYKNQISSEIENKFTEEFPKKERRKKRNWFFRPTGIFVIVISAGVIMLSFLSPKTEANTAMSVVIMLIRSLVITFLWYTLVAPFAKKIFQKYLSKRKSEYSRELEEIISMFPQFRKIVNYCWSLSNKKKGITRIRYFLSTSFFYLLLSK